MKNRLLMAVAGVLTLIVAGSAPVSAAPPEEPERVWIVQLGDGTDPGSEGREIARAHGGQVRRVLEVINGYSFEGTADEAARLARHPRVDLVEPDHAVQALADVVPTGVDRIDAEPSQGAGTGSGVAVAVIDTGIDLDHPDLAANIHADLGADCVDWDDKSSFADDDGHGTHVSGTIAAAADGAGVVGVAPEVDLVPVKVLDSGGSGTWESVICGIDYVTANSGAIGVANMSLGGSGSAGDPCGLATTTALRQAICDSVDAGVFYAVAAGNDADDAANHVPAAYPEVTTVSALHDTNGEVDTFGSGPCESSGPPWARTCDDALADFSNHGAVDVMAPGVEIYSTYWDDTYATASGTSMASPHAAAVAALVRAADASLDPAGVEAVLQGTGECPDGTTNANSAGDCAEGQGDWVGDPDGVAEPLVDAATAVAAVGGGDGGDGDDGGDDSPPADEVTLSATSTSQGSTWTAIVTVTGAEGTYSGVWSDGATGTGSCTIGTGETSCTVSKSSIHKRVASVTFTLDTGESITVSKP